MVQSKIKKLQQSQLANSKKVKNDNNSEQGQFKQTIISNQSVGSYKPKAFDIFNIKG